MNQWQFGSHRATNEAIAPARFVLWAGVVAAVTATIFGDSCFVRQPEMAQDQMRGSFFTASYKPDNILPAGVVKSVSIAAQTPTRQPQSFLTFDSGVQGPNVAPTGTIGRVFVDQKQPWHPQPFTQNSPIFSTLGQLQGSRIIIGQEQPWHPGSFFNNSYLYDIITIVPPVTRSVFVEQKQPWHPLPWTNPGVQGPSVAPTGTIGSVLVRQQQPWHPLPFIYNQKFNDPVPVGVARRVLIRQEDPWHPRTMFSNIYAFVQTPPAFTLAGRQVFIKQEYPQFHPKPYTFDTKFYISQLPPYDHTPPPLIENLTDNMLTGNKNVGFFYTDSAVVLTQINDPNPELEPVGWEALGLNINPRSNMYKKDIKYTPPAAPVPWWKSPDQVGNWPTDEMNATEARVRLKNQISFFDDPLQFQINQPSQQLYGVGFMPVGQNITPRGIIRGKPYG